MAAPAPEPPPGAPAPDPAPDAGAVRDAARRLAAAAASSAREAAETVYAARLEPRPGSGRVARFAYGAGVPIAVLGAVLADPAARRRYLRTSLIQAALTFALGLGLALGTKAAFGWLRSLESNNVTAQGTVAFWSGLYGALCAAEWIVIALSRQYHDAIGRDAALLTGAPPEDGPLTPGVKIDLRWLWKVMKRRMRGFRMIFAGIPALTLLMALPSVGQSLYAGATAAWSAYWLAVFVGAKSAQAWKEEHTAPAPWFVRGWERATERVPGLRWSVPRAYGRFLRRSTTPLFSPAHRFERSPWELAGLAFARVVGGLPGLYPFVRPLVPVAAAHVLLARERADARALEEEERDRAEDAKGAKGEGENEAQHQAG